MGSAVGSCCAQSSKREQAIRRKFSQNSSSGQTIKNKKNKQSLQDANTDFTQKDILKLLGNLIIVMNQVKITDFDIEGVIGAGAFGVVLLGQLRKEKRQGKQIKYAIKKMSKQLIIKQKLLVNVKDQRDIMTICNKFMVSLIFAFQDEWFLYLVMEYAVGGDTYELVKQGSFKCNMFKKQGQNGIRFIAACVILALECIHEQNYIYRDLKPQNVLIFQNGYVKLTDFGLVKKSLSGRNNHTISGTQPYLAPQMLLKQGYGKQVDFWTLGIYIYELSNSQTPFKQQQITKRNFQAACLQSQKKRVWVNPNLSAQIKDFMDKLLKFSPNQRLGAKHGWKQVKQHCFFGNFDWEQLKLGNLQSPLVNIVSMFPPSIKPFRNEVVKKTSSQLKIEGWSYQKNQKQKILS